MANDPAIFRESLKEVLARVDLDSIILEAGDYIKVLTIADNDEGFDLLPSLSRCDPLDGQKRSTGFTGDAEASLMQHQTTTSAYSPAASRTRSSAASLESPKKR